jgi:integrase
LWTIPKSKTTTEHRVPLSAAAVRLLQQLQQQQQSNLVFPSPQNPGKPLSNAAMAAVIDRINNARAQQGLPRYTDPKQGDRDVVPQGFRATFKSWSSDCTNAQRDVIEACLSHVVSGELEAAYRRTDFLQKRRRLMRQWAAFVQHPATTGATVLPFATA